MKTLLLALVFSLSLNQASFAAANPKSSRGKKAPARAEQVVETDEAEEEEEEPAPVRRRARRDANNPDLSMLTTDEIRILQYGEISGGSHVAGGLLGTFLGLGLGHIVYGKYGSKGWIFTLGELGALGIASAGLTSGVLDCSFGNVRSCQGGLGLYYIGALTFMGLRIWEIIDVWTIPSVHNSELSVIKAKLEYGRPYGVKWTVYPSVAPVAGRGMSYGLGIAASF